MKICDGLAVTLACEASISSGLAAGNVHISKGLAEGNVLISSGLAKGNVLISTVEISIFLTTNRIEILTSSNRDMNRFAGSFDMPTSFVGKR